MSFCVQAFKESLKKHGVEQRNDNEILTLLIEIYKAHKKLKNVSQKESPFSGVMVDTYKSYAEGKVWLQENVNYLDSANKFCNCITNGLKYQDKQQQLTGQRQTLEELGMKNLGPSLSKITTSFPTTSVATTGNQTPTGGKSPAITKPVTPQQIVVSVNTTTITTPTTTICASTPSTTPTTTTVTAVPSRPRGRPPGSKNSFSKAQADATKNAAMQQKVMSSLLQPITGSYGLEMITSQLDPSVKMTVLALLTEPKFMQTLADFPDPAGRNTLLREYFKISNFPNIPQLVDGFNSVFNYLAMALQQQTSLAGLIPSQLKPPKAEKSTTAPKLTSTSNSMSIFPTTNKPHSSLTTSPSKSSPLMPATITPVSSSSSLLKSGASTVISVGSGQLTITPSISITPNPTKPTSVLPQMPAPSFIIQKPTFKPKVRRSAGDKSTKASQKAQRLSQGSNSIFPDLPPISVENLPKSLSIIPTSNSFIPSKPITVELPVGGPMKRPKPKKKSIDGNKNVTSQSKKMTQINGAIDPNLLKKSLANPLMNQYDFLSHYERFLTIVPPTLSLPKNQKTKTSTVTSATVPKPKATIKVKQLDQLQAQKTSKLNEKLAQKSKQPSFQAPNIAKNPPISSSSVLNAYGTTISSIPHPSQTISTSFSPLPTVASNLSANLQIR